MGSTGKAPIPKTSAAKDLHLLKTLVSLIEVPDALEASAVNFDFSINEATSRESGRHEGQKSVSQISTESTPNSLKRKRETTKTRKIDTEVIEKEHMRQHMIINMYK